MMNHHVHTSRWLAAALVAMIAPASGDEGPDTSDLEALLGESVVTTASRSAERASVAPSTVFNITAAEMLQSGVRTVDEALEFLGLGIYVAKPRDYDTGIDVGAQGLLRRDAGRHVLVMLDGIILNSQATGRISIHEALGVPFDLIDHIEVMLGPGSVVYGSNAMLAVINVVTRRARDLPRLGISAEIGTAAAQDASGQPTTGAGTSFGLRYRLSIGGGGRFQLGRTAGEATAMLEWTQEDSASYAVLPFTMADPGNQSFLPDQRVWGGYARHRMRAPSGVVTLRLGDFRLLVSGFYYDRGMPLVGTFNDPYAREQQAGVRLDLAHSWQISPRFTLDTRLYGAIGEFAERSNYGEAFWCIAGQNGCHEESSARSGWIGLEQRLAADWFTDSKLVTTAGYDLRPRFIDSTPASYTDLFTGAVPPVVPLPHARNSSFVGAIFAQQVWRPRPWLALNAGGRLDLDEEFGVSFSPRAAVVVTPGSSTTLRASYNEAFSAPSQYELTEFDPTYRITPRSLRPETVRSVEFEAQQRLWRLNLSARGYVAFYDDLIDSRAATMSEVAAFSALLSPTADPTQIVVRDNVDALQIFGGSAAVQARLPLGLNLRLTGNFARAQKPDGTTYEGLPLAFGNFRAAWHSGGDDGYSVTLTGVYASTRIVMNGVVPTSFHLGPRLDLRLSAAGPVWGIPGLHWRAAVGFDLNPFLPYVITVNTDTPLTYVLYPDQPRLFGFIGLQYELRP